MIQIGICENNENTSALVSNVSSKKKITIVETFPRGFHKKILGPF